MSLLKRDNTKLVALILPPKGVSNNVPENIYTNTAISRSRITSDYKTLVKIFSDSGVITPNLIEFAKSKTNIPFFLTTDHHWNNAVLNDLSAYTANLLTKDTRLEKVSVEISQRSVVYRGSLAKTVDNACGKSPAEDIKIQSYKATYSDVGLLDEVIPQVALIGTSNSRRPLPDGSTEESFASLLAKNGKFAVYNGAIDGGGPYASFEDYFLNQYNINKPKVIVWEFYAYEPLLSSEFLKSIEPLVDISKIKVLDRKIISVKSGIFSVNFKVKDSINYIRVRIDDKSITNFNVRLTIANKDITKLVSRSERVRNNGEFFIYIEDVSKTDLKIKFDRPVRGSVDLVKF